MTSKTERIAALLRERITTGQLGSPGDRLPRTSDLATEFDVSRATVTDALAQLGREGHLEYGSARTGWRIATHSRRRVVARARLSAEVRSQGLSAFQYDAQVTGTTPQVTTEVSSTTPPLDVAADLHLTSEDSVVMRDRVMRLDDEVVQLATGYIPASIASGTAIEQENPGPGGILQRLSELDYEPQIYTERIYPARSSTPEEAEYLGLTSGAPVCQIDRTAWSAGTPVLAERIVVDPWNVELTYDMPAT